MVVMEIAPLQWVLGLVLILSSLGVLLAKEAVHACLSFMLALLTLAGLYLELHVELIAALQVLVYAGAILVLFMFVIVLFQDAHAKILHSKARSNRWLIVSSASLFAAAFLLFAIWMPNVNHHVNQGTLQPAQFGTLKSIGKALYIDYFFPFEAVILLFLVAIVGALYIGKKERS